MNKRGEKEEKRDGKTENNKVWERIKREKRKSEKHEKMKEGERDRDWQLNNRIKLK